MKIVDFDFDRAASYDVVVAVCGYERRSSYIARLGVSATHRMALVYPASDGQASSADRDAFSERGWVFVMEGELASRFAEVCASMVKAKVLVDISSMSRATMALMVETLWNSASVGEVHFVYAPAQYDASADAATVVPQLSAGPVSPFYAGSVRTAAVPIGLVLGLGLEPHRAGGLIELLEPSRVWGFAAVSDDLRFKYGVDELHRELLTESPRTMLLHYDLHSVANLYLALESLIFSTSLDHRMVLAPSGPKLFTLASLLVASPRDASRPAVWRVGAALGSRPPSSVGESGEIVACSVVFRPSRHAG